jgi:NTP pyrophosphatase (non-canonical NTP hydrolase)
MTIQELQKRCFEQARDKGWTEKPVEVPEQVALICSEACEGLEAWREKQPISWTDQDGKPQGIGSEYADVVIRIGHYAELLGIDLESEILRKLDYNKTRPYRHGNKLA